MNIRTDLHCHTVASTHAYSTVMELAQEAKEQNLEAIAITDHGIAMPDAPHIWHFENLRVLPDYIAGVRILKGCEANILDPAGTLDMPAELLRRLDIVIASIHTSAHTGEAGSDYTRAYLQAVENPYVDIIGHSGHPKYPYNYEEVLLRAKDARKLIEMNESSFTIRRQNIENCRAIALKCKELGVGITVNSDAHICTAVGKHTKVLAMLKEIEFPEELIMNRSLAALSDYFAPRKIIRL